MIEQSNQVEVLKVRLAQARETIERLMEGRESVRLNKYGHALSEAQGLQHNVKVCYWSQPYTASEGGEFTSKEIMLMEHGDGYLSLTCKEAYFLLQWLKQEEGEIKRVVEEEEGIKL